MKKENESKNDESASFFKELGSFMEPYKMLYALSIIISIFGVACNVLSYAYVGMIAAMFFQGLNSSVWLLVLKAIICRVLSGVFINLSTWCSHKAAYRTLKDVRMAMSSKMLKLPMGYFEVNGSGRIKNLICDQVENMEKPLAHVLPELTGNLLVPLALLVWMFFIDWRLGLCTLIWIILGFSVTGGMMKNYPEKYSGQIKADKAMSQAITEYVGGIEVIKNFGQTDQSCQKYEKAVYGHAEYNVNWQKETQVYSALGMAIAPFSLFPVLILGLILYAHNSLDASTLFLSVLLTMGIFGPLMQTMGYFDQLAQMGTVAKEMRSILDYPELKRGSLANPINADIEFKNVSFSYNNDNKLALNNISFKVCEGTMLALVGPSGSGKSTIAKLIAGYWDANKGDVLIGNELISNYNQEQLNKMIAYVDQDTFLFNKTIEDNIKIARPDATLDEVIDVCKKVNIDEFIRKLPNGYQTMAGSAGSMLSGGEKQRIAIARAMIKNAPIMILDEATASADPENEALIQEALIKASYGKTLIVIAHHLSTIKNADQIAYVNDGEIKAIGTHDELMKNYPDYSALYALSKEG